MNEFDELKRKAEKIVDAIGDDNLLLMYVVDVYSKKHNVTKFVSKLDKSGDIKIEMTTKPKKGEKVVPIRFEDV